MSIHYKFNTALQFDTVTFDGLHITLKELKKQISQQKKIGKDYDLQVTNAQTKEVFKDDNELISKNSSLVVARIPVTNQARKQWDRDNHNANLKSDESAEATLTKSVDLSSLDLTEEDKIKTMMSQSTSDYDPANYVKMRGYNQVGPVPPTYICFKCHQRGHWIKDCKITVEGPVGEIKKSTGIPRSFMVPVDGPQVPGARLTPSGEFVAASIDLQVYKEKKIEKPPFLAEKEAAVEATAIPEDLQCSICKDLMQDAVMAPCCGNSFCDECIRNVLVESDDAECPECNEKEVSPDTLIPNRFVRNNVNNFKNKTGYTKRIVMDKKSVSPPRPTLPDFIPPSAITTVTTEKPTPPTVDNAKKELKEDPPKLDSSSESANNDAFLYDIAVEKDRNKIKDYRRGRGSGRKDDESSDSSSDSSDSYDPTEDREEKGYAIPSLGLKNQHSQRNVGMHGQERSGTPTVDERYDVYGPGVPPGVMPLMPPGIGMPVGPFPPMGMPIPPPMYNPNFPPPMMGPGPNPMPMMGGPPLMGFPMRGPDDYHRDRDRDRGRGRPYRGRYAPHRPSAPTHDNDEAFRAFERMLKEKEERDKLKNRPSRADSHSRSRSPRSRPRSRSRSKSGSLVSNGRRRSYTPTKRSRSRSKSIRRSRSPSARARSRSYASRSRSRSYTKSPARVKKSSPRRPASPHRSPTQRYDRSRDERRDRDREREYTEGSYGWDRRGRRGGTYSRSRPSHYSPQRQYGSYNRYKEGYGSPSRGHTPDHYGDVHSYDRGYSSRHNEKDRYRRRSRSRSHSRERERIRSYHEEGRGERDRSESRGWARDRERSPDDRHRYRDDRNGHSKYRDDEHDDRRRSVDRERRHSPRSNRTRSPALKSRDKKPSPSPGKHQRKHSHSPKPDARNPSPIQTSKSREEEMKEVVVEPLREIPALAPTPTLPVQRTPSPPPRKMEESPPRVEQMDLARNPSPAVTEKSLTKKDKKKDKEKKKRKKEKETEEEREARKKRKREKKEKKRNAEIEKNEKNPTKELACTPQDSALLNEPVLENPTETEVPAENTRLAATVSEPPSTFPPIAKPASVPEISHMEIDPMEETKVAQSSPIKESKDAAVSREESDEEFALELTASYENLLEPEPEVLAPLPALSRWEMEEAEVRHREAPPAHHTSSESTSVTNEVIKRAENAIFKKAISALQPLKKAPSSEKSREKDKERTQETKENDKKVSDETVRKSDGKSRDETAKKAVVETSRKTDSGRGRDDSAKKVAVEYEAARKSESKRRDESVKKLAIAVEYGSDSKTKERRIVKEPREEVIKRTISTDAEPAKIASSERPTERVYTEVKGKQDKRKPGNSIQITIPVAEKVNAVKTTVASEEVKSPPGRVPAKDRLGLKVDKPESSLKKIRVEKPIFQKIAEPKKSSYSEEESSAEEKPVKIKRHRKKSPEAKKRHRSSSESSDEIEKKKKKRQKNKKEKRSKKKARKDDSESSYSSDSEFERKRSKKSKKKKKSRHS